MSNVIVATLRFVDKFTSPMNNAVKSMERSAKQAQQMGKEIQKTGKNITNVGSSLKKVGNSITKGLTEPMQKARDESVKLASDLNKSMKKVDSAFDKNSKNIKNSSKATSTSSGKAKGAAQDFQKMGKKISDVGSGLTKSITVPILKVGIESFKLASDLSGSMDKVDNTFGKNSTNIKKWSKTTLSSFGISQGTALDMASSFGDMATSLGFTDKVQDMSLNMVSLAGNLASFKNVGVDVANNALAGVFTGDTDSLSQLGIEMSKTKLAEYARSQGIKKSIDNMTQQEQVQLRYNYLMSKTKNVQGDFAKNSDKATNQQRIFSESLKQLGATLGTKLLPVGLKIISWVNSMIAKFSGLSDSQKGTILKFAGIAAAIGPGITIFGKLTTGVGGTITTFKNVGGAIGKGAKAFDKLKDVGKIGGAFSKFGRLGKAAFMAVSSPAFIAVAVIAAIAIAAFLIIKNWSKVKMFFGKLGNFIKGVFVKCGGDVNMFGNLFKKAKNVISRAVANLKPVIRSIIQFFTPTINFLKGVFVTRIKIAFKLFSSIVSARVKAVIGCISGLLTVFDGITTFISGVFTGNWSKAWLGVKKIFYGIFQSFTAIVKTPMNIVIGLINNAINGINKLSLTIPDWVPKIGGKTFSINVPTIPMLAKGTNNWKGGLAQINEPWIGGEIVDLPSGSRVYPHDKSVQMARKEGKSGSITVKIEKLADKIEVRSEKDIDVIVNKLANKLEKVFNNTGKVVPA